MPWQRVGKTHFQMLVCIFLKRRTKRIVCRMFPLWCHGSCWGLNIKSHESTQKNCLINGWENGWNSLAFSEHLSIKNRGVALHFSSAPVAAQHLYAKVCLVVVWIRLRLPSTQINLAGKSLLKLFFSLMNFRDFPNKTSIYRGFSC